jgi:hypothetical protein
MGPLPGNVCPSGYRASVTNPTDRPVDVFLQHEESARLLGTVEAGQTGEFVLGFPPATKLRFAWHDAESSEGGRGKLAHVRSRVWCSIEDSRNDRS